MSTTWLSLLGVLAGIAVVLFGAIATTGPRARPFAFRRWEGVPTTAALIRDARVGVKARAGEMNADFWSNPAIVAAIEHMLAGGGRLEVVFGPYLDVRNKEFVSHFASNPHAAFRLSASREMPHFLVIDDEYLCLEGDHAPLSEDREGVLIHSSLAREFSAGFRQVWDAAQDVDLCTRLVGAPTGEPLQKHPQLELIAPADGEGIRPADSTETQELLEAACEEKCATEQAVGVS